MANILRPYQSRAFSLISEHFQKKEKKILLVMPTGAGKTVIFCQLLKKVYEIIGGRDTIEQDELYELQEIVGNEIISEAQQGNMRIKQLSNGYIEGMDFDALSHT